MKMKDQIILLNGCEIIPSQMFGQMCAYVDQRSMHCLHVLYRRSSPQISKKLSLIQTGLLLELYTRLDWARILMVR